MAVKGCEIKLSGVAAANDLSDHQYRFVRISSNLMVDAADGTSQPIGVLQNDPGIGEGATVTALGQCKVVAGEAIAVGSLIGVNSNGEAVTGGNIGMALSSARAAGEIITIFIK